MICISTYAKFVILSCCFLVADSGVCQNTNYLYELGLPYKRIGQSRYNTFTFLDSRQDTGYMGFVQLGALNRPEMVVPIAPLEQQFKRYFEHLVDSTAGSGNILLQLRQLQFAEIATMEQKGYCHFRVSAYAQIESWYLPLFTIDTLIKVTGTDVTRAMMVSPAKLLFTYLFSWLRREPHALDSMEYFEILAIDSIEKQQLPLYTKNELPDGIYLSYESFKTLRPDGMVTGRFELDTVPTFYTANRKGKSTLIGKDDAYALVWQGIPYITTGYGFYPLRKASNEFIFTGKVKVSADILDQTIGYFFLGITGMILMSHETAIKDLRIDHLNGKFIPLAPDSLSQRKSMN
jgi:hypothetical protein